MGGTRTVVRNGILVELTDDEVRQLEASCGEPLRTCRICGRLTNIYFDEDARANGQPGGAKCPRCAKPEQYTPPKSANPALQAYFDAYERSSPTIAEYTLFYRGNEQDYIAALDGLHAALGPLLPYPMRRELDKHLMTESRLNGADHALDALETQYAWLPLLAEQIGSDLETAATAWELGQRPKGFGYCPFEY